MIKNILNGHPSRSFHPSPSVSQGSTLGPTLFLIYISNFSDVISYQLGIYTDETSIYSSLSSKSNRPDEVNITALEKDFQLDVNCDKRWLINFNGSKTILFSFNHHEFPVT